VVGPLDDLNGRAGLVGVDLVRVRHYVGLGISISHEDMCVINRPISHVGRSYVRFPTFTIFDHVELEFRYFVSATRHARTASEFEDIPV
jgi:hypothetical protein